MGPLYELLIFSNYFPFDPSRIFSFFSPLSSGGGGWVGSTRGEGSSALNLLSSGCAALSSARASSHRPALSNLRHLSSARTNPHRIAPTLIGPHRLSSTVGTGLFDTLLLPLKDRETCFSTTRLLQSNASGHKLGLNPTGSVVPRNRVGSGWWRLLQPTHVPVNLTPINYDAGGVFLMGAWPHLTS